jgi:putative transcriptional regulator
VEDVHILAEELRRSGFEISVVTHQSVDVKKLRERLSLTQEQFALRFGLELDAVQNWEHGRREPDAAARSYLTVIQRAPETVQEALASPVP